MNKEIWRSPGHRVGVSWGQTGKRPMRTPPDRSGSRRVDVYPQVQTCPECQPHVKEQYHQQRWIMQLTQQVKVVSHFLRCYNAGCRWREAVYGPEQEGVLA